jgi:hypothetical protein
MQAKLNTGLGGKMVMDPKEAQAVGKFLLKQGKADITVKITAGPNDRHFAEQPPTCEVTLKANSSKVPPQTKELASTDNHQGLLFRIEVETIVGVLSRVFQRKRPERLEITIAALPIGGWEDMYEAATRTVTVKAGESPTFVVTLKRRSS